MNKKVKERSDVGFYDEEQIRKAVKEKWRKNKKVRAKADDSLIYRVGHYQINFSVNKTWNTISLTVRYTPTDWHPVIKKGEYVFQVLSCKSGEEAVSQATIGIALHQTKLVSEARKQLKRAERRRAVNRVAIGYKNHL